MKFTNLDNEYNSINVLDKPLDFINIESEENDFLLLNPVVIEVPNVKESQEEEPSIVIKTPNIYKCISKYLEVENALSEFNTPELQQKVKKNLNISEFNSFLLNYNDFKDSDGYFTIDIILQDYDFIALCKSGTIVIFKNSKNDWSIFQCINENIKDINSWVDLEFFMIKDNSISIQQLTEDLQDKINKIDELNTGFIWNEIN